MAKMHLSCYHKFFFFFLSFFYLTQVKMKNGGSGKMNVFFKKSNKSLRMNIALDWNSVVVVVVVVFVIIVIDFFIWGGGVEFSSFSLFSSIHHSRHCEWHYNWNQRNGFNSRLYECLCDAYFPQGMKPMLFSPYYWLFRLVQAI